MGAAPVVGKLYDLYGSRILLSSGLILSGLILSVTMAMPSMELTIVIFALAGITISMGLTPMLPLMTDLFCGKEHGLQGLLYGIYNTLFSLGLVIGPFLGGALITRAGMPMTMGGLSVLLILIGLLFFVAIRDKGKRTC